MLLNPVLVVVVVATGSIDDAEQKVMVVGVGGDVVLV